MTLKDVAKQAGVSATTVSRVLNGNYYVSPEITERVLTAVHALNYKPNAIARSLRNSRTHTISVIVPDISNPYFMRLVRAVENLIREHGYIMVVSSSDDDPVKEKELLNVLETRTDGLIVATCESDLKQSNIKEAAQHVPMVLFDRLVEGSGIPTVIEENEHGAYELVKHLISLGHQDIAIINSSASISTVELRQRGYERALLEAGIPRKPEFEYRGQFDEKTGYIGGKRVLTLEQRPSAIFCTNNFITVGTMLAIQELRLSIPQDVSIVSFGDLLVPELITPRITAVIQNPEEVGSTAALILLEALTNKNNQSDARRTSGEIVVLPTHVRLGDSVKPWRE